ncbi:hypothetical protein NUW54_g10540 [Trametes sanguinea]|uniref:Uncharacterized protein n=1 Tax=Trametes sanguinea TaxID=158606 RepID=A0ACC1P0U0_9APHY|nr:hypothetical protein NUW54_g10540 [Trametes sanguinea]
MYLASLTDSQNHCVRIKEILSDPLDSHLSLMVMPYLRPCNDPDFSTVGDVIDFVSQTLEGLVFMHKHRVAHRYDILELRAQLAHEVDRDIAMMNIMMDASSLYPAGHHPVRRGYAPDGLYPAAALPRGSRSITYYYVDFGLSSMFSEGEPVNVVGRVGRDKQAPELSSTVPYDPFKIDIFALGNLYFKEFEQKYNNMHFLVPLIENMRKADPQARLSAAELLQQWQGLRADIKESLYRWRLGPKSEPPLERVLNDTVAVAWEGIHHLKKFVR